MNNAHGFRPFFWLILTAFLFLWIGFVAIPWMQVGHLQPIRDEGGTDITPWDKPNAAHRGEAVYASNGCAYCHTQQVRPETSGADFVRGWATAHNDDGKEIKRRSFPRDYVWDQQVFLGTNREGADLTNAGERFPSAEALYRYLYNAATTNPHSSMPAYRFLFTLRRIAGQPSADALTLPPGQAAPAGYEIVPTPEARALVAYLLALKNDYHLPDEKGPVAPPVAKS